MLQTCLNSRRRATYNKKAPMKYRHPVSVRPLLVCNRVRGEWREGVARRDFLCRDVATRPARDCHQRFGDVTISESLYRDSPDVNGEPKESDSANKQLRRVPAKLLGRILDHGKASAYAVHLLAIKCAHGNGFVLNERDVGKRYNISRCNFQAGIRRLKQAGVLERAQPNHRDYARETLVEAGGGYVLFPESLLQESSKVIAFVLAVTLARGPRKPAEIAGRIGITSDTTIRKLTRAAIEHGCEWNDPGHGRQILLARRGYIFDPVKNHPAKKHTAKKSTAHSGMRDSHSGMRGAHNGMKAEQGTGPENSYPKQDSNYEIPRNEFEGARSERCFRGDPSFHSDHCDDVVQAMLDGLWDGMWDVEDTLCLSDRDIIDALKCATDGRIGSALWKTEEGIDSARCLIAVVMGHAPYDIDEGEHSGYDFEDLCNAALDALCSLIWQRIGSKRNKWLNSWAMVTLPLAAMVKSGSVEELYGPSNVTRRAATA